MVWSFQYKPRGSSFPLAEIAEGNTGALQLVDTTRDGGVALLGGAEGFSGRRVKAESVPKVIRWLSKRPIQDFEASFRKTVSTRLRALIEEIEPDTHQFEAISFVAKNGDELELRWFWQICNRIDSVNREKTNWVLRDGAIWVPPPKSDQFTQSSLVFDLDKIGSKKFWNYKHMSSSDYCSDETKAAIDEAGITGIEYRHRDQI